MVKKCCVNAPTLWAIIKHTVQYDWTVRKLKYTLFLSILLGNFTVYCQIKDAIQFGEYLIKTSKINFHFNDSLYPNTLLVEPDGRFYFKTNFVEGEPYIRVMLDKSKKERRAKKTIQLKDVFKQKTDSIIVIESLFPHLIVNDSSFINEYPFEYELLPLINELTYSFILNKLNEPSLYNCEKKRAIRVTIPAEGIENPGRYSFVRVEFENKKAILKYAEGDFDKEGNYQILKSKTCSLTEKDRVKAEKGIKKINFSKEYYFVKANLDTKYLIEYREGDKYYALERPLYRKEYQALWMILTFLALNPKCKE